MRCCVRILTGDELKGRDCCAMYAQFAVKRSRSDAV